MQLHKSRGLWLLFLGLVVTVVAYFWFVHSPYFVIFNKWASQNILLLSVTLVTVKIIGIVIPPIPGGLLTLGAIPILGWWRAYLVDFIGAMIGSSIAYYLGVKYGNKLLHKLFDKKLIERVENVKIKKNREIESIIILRFVFGSTIVEIICYAAGLLKISYKNFIIGSAVSHIIIGVPTYYFANNLIEFKNLWINGLIVLIAFPLIWKLRHRYIE